MVHISVSKQNPGCKIIGILSSNGLRRFENLKIVPRQSFAYNIEYN